MAVLPGKSSSDPVDGNLAATYTLIYSFLTKHSHTKAAEALKKSAKDVVVLKDNMEVDGPSLDRIVKEWKTLAPK
ncbi:hypothetical protein PHLCEN_2v7829 [Hermanssonia centrifuga]|uniref:LisH domain-containing protein n=1 Tax=Hermanssonia centrifuga TaxID=98765 RepID=A0A2R6NW69_9APHY|nr:hypothetical protein PHLCEN_2v7829 [Hermanssonia centrifuga]